MWLSRVWVRPISVSEGVAVIGVEDLDTDIERVKFYALAVWLLIAKVFAVWGRRDVYEVKGRVRFALAIYAGHVDLVKYWYAA